MRTESETRKGEIVRIASFFLYFAMMLTLALLLLGCADSRQALGLEKAPPPDEFSVVPNSPLAVPEEFQLPAPHPGIEVFVPRNMAEERSRFLLGTAAPAQNLETPEASPSPGEAALLQRAGVVSATKGIRGIVNQEALDEGKKGGTMFDKLTFWRDRLPSGIVLDPGREARRLRENREAGKPVTEGETPTVRSKKGLF